MPQVQRTQVVLVVVVPKYRKLVVVVAVVAAVAQAVPAQVQLPQLTPRAAVVGKGPRPPPAAAAAAAALELADRPRPPPRGVVAPRLKVWDWFAAASAAFACALTRGAVSHRSCMSERSWRSVKPDDSSRTSGG